MSNKLLVRGEVKMNENATELKKYVETNKEELSNKCWNVLLKILNDRNDGRKYEIVSERGVNNETKKMGKTGISNSFNCSNSNFRDY